MILFLLQLKKNKVSSSQISNCCRGKGRSVNGFYWKFSNEKINLNNIQNKTHAKINAFDLDYNFIKTFNKMEDAVKELKVKSNCIVNCCRGKVLKTKNYIFEYFDEELKNKYKRESREPKRTFKKICQIKDNNVLVFNFSNRM